MSKKEISDKRGRGRPPKAAAPPIAKQSVSNNYIGEDEQLDYDAISQIIEINERSNQVELDSIIASNVAAGFISNDTIPDDMAQIMEQIRVMEQIYQNTPQSQQPTQQQPQSQQLPQQPPPHISNAQTKYALDRELKRQQDEEYTATLAADQARELERKSKIHVTQPIQIPIPPDESILVQVPQTKEEQLREAREARLKFFQKK